MLFSLCNAYAHFPNTRFIRIGGDLLSMLGLHMNLRKNSPGKIELDVQLIFSAGTIDKGYGIAQSVVHMERGLGRAGFW